jgi:hypothetical protein
MVGARLRENFGRDKLEPLPDRLAALLSRLEEQEAVKFRELNKDKALKASLTAPE